MRLLRGVVVAHTTHFDDQGRVDHGVMKAYVRFLIDKGVDGIFVCGTTAEAQILSLEERKQILEDVIATNEGNMVVVAQCGTANLEDTRALLQHAYACGADGAGIVTPYYYRYTQEELYEYYAILAREFKDFPLYPYNIPVFTGNNLEASTLARLSAEFPNIVGVKDSSGDLTHVSQYLLETRSGFMVLVGYDRAFLPVLFMGAQGTVTGPGGVFPEPFVEVWQAFQGRKYEQAIELQEKLTAISIALEEGRSLAALKAALKLRGLGNGRMRLPFQSLLETEVKKLEKRLKEVLVQTGYQW